MLLIWNSTATHFFGIPPKAYNQGDTVQPFMFSDNIFRQHIANGRLIYVETPKTSPIKLSISVMAHPSRESYFPRLREKLGDVPFAIDRKNNLIDNCRDAWNLHDPTADFHVVIQDDAIVCNNFKERAEKFITEMESQRIAMGHPVYGYNFFSKPEYSSSQMSHLERKVYLLEPRNRGGVAICLPVNKIKSLFAFYDTLKDRHDDERISQWIVKNKYMMCFPIPSLVDHDDNNPSLAGNPAGQDRKAFKFIDNKKFIIPKIIHQLWIGDKPAPTKWMKTWREKNPGWLYRLWTEKDLLSEEWINIKHINYYYKKKIWYGVSDVCTYEILHNHGGFMATADSICKLSIDDLFSDEYDSYGVYEQEKIRPGLISPLIAGVKESKFAKELIDGLFKLKEVGEPWQTTGNIYMQKMYEKTKHKVKIFPSYTFNPVHFTGEKYEGNGKIYALQMWGSTIDGYAQGVESTEKTPIKLSISVMAHPSRAEFFPYLKDRLGDVPFSIDQKNCLLENSKAAWRMYDPEADFHCVIQDDCIVCDNFKERAIKFITEQEEKRVSENRRPQGYNFFIKNADDQSKLEILEDYFIDSVTRAGLSICLPVKFIKPMLIEFDNQKSRHDDDRISGFMKKHEYKVVFPFPSLIDHRIELESLANNIVGLHAIKFIDNKKEKIA